MINLRDLHDSPNKGGTWTPNVPEENGTKTYVDHSIDSDGMMVMYAYGIQALSAGDGVEFNVYGPDSNDIKRRKITLKERFCNWLILKLGGELKRCYTDVHINITKSFDLWTMPEQYYEEE